MKRQIKFKAWDIKHKVILDIFDNTIGVNWFLPNVNENFEVMQFTGLKDKKGKEIYVGDILKETISVWASEREKEKFAKEKNYYIIKQSQNSINVFLEYNFNCRGYWETNILNIDCVKDLEIVGNIYENPEMMEVK